MNPADRNKLKDFVFVDQSLLDKYVDQIRDAFVEVDKKSWRMTASITGPAIEASRTKERIPLKTHEKIDLVETFLQTREDLYSARPTTISNGDAARPRFVLETTDATKVLLPLASAGPVNGLSSVSLWISDPDPAGYVHEPYDWRGTFLYLSEIHWDTAGCSYFLSGVSALQAVVNLTRGLDFFHLITDEFEPFGRGSDLHPIDKLKQIGGVVMDRRRIKSLYRIRYFTNEQTYRHEDQQRRVNDLLGYPLYISSED